jgi:predicted dehydrogenase
VEDVRIGFIGAGGKGQSHMQQLRQVEGVQFVAVCDVSSEMAQRVGLEYGATPYTDHHQMLDSEELDALYIVVPPFAHTDAELLAAERGIHLFVEKPVVLNLDKGLEILDAVERTGIITSVGYQMRYTEPATWARQFLGGRTVAMMSVHRWGGAPAKPWWRLMAESGGQLVEQTTHQVDAVRYLTADEIVEVYASYAQRVLTDIENFDIPDVYALTFRMGSGAIGSLTSACTVSRREGTSSGLAVLLDDGLRLELTRQDVLVYPDGVDVPEFGAGAPIDLAFVQAIRTGDRSLILSDYRDGLVSCAVTLAANESAEKGQPVVPYFARQGV